MTVGEVANHLGDQLRTPRETPAALIGFTAGDLPTSDARGLLLTCQVRPLRVRRETNTGQWVGVEASVCGGERGGGGNFGGKNRKVGLSLDKLTW